MRTFHLFGMSISPWIVVPLFYGAWILIGWMLKKFVFAWLHRFSSRTSSRIDDILLRAADVPVLLMIFVWGGAALLQFILPEAREELTRPVLIGSKIITILAVVWFVDSLLSNVIDAYAHRVEILQVSQAYTGVLVHVLAFGIGALVLLDSLGISITPIIASLGIGSLAVALALQPTLENVFAGFQILTDQPLRPGQFVKLESGEEGYVERIGWRTTWIRQLANNMVVIPNKQLVNTRLTNFYYPTKELAVLVELGVHYTSDLDKVERVTIEVGEEVLKRTPGAISDFKPFIRYHTLAASSINFSVILRAQEFVDNYLIRHEFIKALCKRYAQENIVVPYPITAINTSQEQARLIPGH
jgi:small-conductance mechanosensitive channel